MNTFLPHSKASLYLSARVLVRLHNLPLKSTSAHSEAASAFLEKRVHPLKSAASNLNNARSILKNLIVSKIQVRPISAILTLRMRHFRLYIAPKCAPISNPLQKSTFQVAPNATSALDTQRFASRPPQRQPSRETPIPSHHTPDGSKGPMPDATNVSYTPDHPKRNRPFQRTGGLKMVGLQVEV